MRTFLALARTVSAALASKVRARRIAAQLDGFTDAQLKDIGLSRYDIRRVARGEMTTASR